MTPATTYDQVLDDLCRHIVQHVEAIHVSLFADHEDHEQLHGYNPNGGGAYCPVTKQLITADAHVLCKCTLPALPAGYHLAHGHHFSGAGVESRSNDLLLFGPDINSDNPESLADALNESYGHELAAALHPAIEELIDADDLEDWQELKTDQTAQIGGFEIVLTSTGVWIGFLAAVAE